MINELSELTLIFKLDTNFILIYYFKIKVIPLLLAYMAVKVLSFPK